ncbi:MAG: matrixin family metalloprotease [Planctomycetota bacterium]
MNRVRKLATEQLECRRVLAASLGWDGPGQGSADLQYYIGEAPGYLDQAEVNAAIETALNVWSDAADIEFTPTSVPGQRDTLDFRFTNIDGPGGTLAQAYFPDDVNPARIAGDVEFDLNDRWEVGNALGRSAFDLVSVAVHEIGHSLGLNHIHESESILAPTISANEEFVGLSSHDIEAIQSLYAPGPDGEVIDSDHDHDETITDPGTDRDRGQNPWNRFRWFTRRGNFDFQTFAFNGSSDRGGMNAFVNRAFNRYNPTDVTGDGATSSLDALITIDAINRGLDVEDLEHQCDTNGDGHISALDALQIVSELNGDGTQIEIFIAGMPQIDGESADSEQVETARTESSLDGMGESVETDSNTDSGTDSNSDVNHHRPFLPILGFGRGGFLDSAVDSLFENFDENSDGMLVESEVPGFAWQFMLDQGVDSDGNNEITLAEIDAALESQRMDRFNDRDGNNDGVITSNELPDFAWMRIQNADTNGDNGVSFDELETFRMLSRFDRIDDNGDGSITQDEVSELMWERLSRFDANEDGAVTESELPERRDPADRFARFAEMAARAFRMFQRWA